MSNIFYKYIGHNITSDYDFLSDLNGNGFDFNEIMNSGDVDSAGVMKDENEIYIEIKDKGFCLLVKNLDDGNHWWLGNIFFYGEGKDGYSGYSGSVIRDVKVGDNISLVTKKFGSQPDFTNKYIVRWDNIDGFKVSFGAIENGVPSVVVVSKELTGNN